MFRDILLATISYPEPTSPEAIGRAVEAAAVLGARISVLACEVEFAPTPNFIAESVLSLSGIVEGERRKSAANVSHILDDFRRETSTRENGGSEHVLRCSFEAAAQALAREARTHDLTIVPVTSFNGVEQWHAEAAIFGSGRPTLVQPLKAGPTLFENVVLAWDGSRVAARAVGDALPALALAKTVSVVTVGDEPDDAAPAAALVRNLVAHGVTAQADKVALVNSVGAALRDHLGKVGADLLVMGAYGHSRLRDFVLGSATKSILANPPVSVWLSR